MKNTNRLSWAKKRSYLGSFRMYPMAYTWMRHPTPETTRAITIDSGSIRRSTSTLNEPTWIHDHRSRSNARSVDACPRSANSRISETTNDAPTAADANTPLSLIRRPDAKITMEAANGSAGTNQIRSKTADPPYRVTIAAPPQFCRCPLLRSRADIPLWHFP